jgi:N6-L-threonylcarbamoyladenine synthase
MKILTIESSCDETAAAVVDDRRQVLGASLASQIDTHRRFGGVVPEIASRSHLEAILPVVSDALAQAETTLDDLDAIAVVNAPGLAGSLLIGLTAAKALCVAANKPLIAINHLQAHIYACRVAFDEDLSPASG